MCPLVYHFAQKKQIVVTHNNANQSIPLLGGIAVAVGIAIPTIIYMVTYPSTFLTALLSYVFVLLCIGIIDDIKNLSPTLRFCIEILVVGIYAYTQHMIDQFYGLWGIEVLPIWISLPLSIIAGVGIINSINLIDGVDGYSSGFGIISCLIFGLFFSYCNETTFAIFLFIVASSLLPFFFYNVFGKKKIYIGDCGTLMIGAIMSSCVFYTLSCASSCLKSIPSNMGIIAFCLAILCIPIFDTLRVMFERIIRKQSPFKGDTTHLHHLLMEKGLSHPQTSLTLITINTLIIGIWWLTYKLGANINTQLYVVLILGILSTFGLSTILRRTTSKYKRTSNK